MIAVPLVMFAFMFHGFISAAHYWAKQRHTLAGFFFACGVLQALVGTSFLIALFHVR